MGATTLGRLSMLVRRLSPVEDKLDLARVAPSDLDGLFRYLGAVLGAAHRRGATKPGRVSAADTKAVLARAITFAGLHEAAYLAYCALARDARLPRAGRAVRVGLSGVPGVGKSTLINALVGEERLRTNAVREGDQRGRHTTTAVELVRLHPRAGHTHGWLIDTPGVRAVSLWASGHGIERAFVDVFDLADRCRFRDCKHEDEPGCAVQAAIAAGELDPRRLDAVKRLVAEEQALEEEQWAQEKALDKRGARRPRRGRAG